MGWDRHRPHETLFGKESRKLLRARNARNAWNWLTAPGVHWWAQRLPLGKWKLPEQDPLGNSARERVRFSLGNEDSRRGQSGCLTREMVKKLALSVNYQVNFSERAEKCDGLTVREATRQRFFIEIYLVEHRVKRLENRRSHRQTMASSTQLLQTVVPSAAHTDRFSDHMPQQSLH